MPTFPKRCRLRHRLEFRQTLDNGLKVVAPELVLFATRMTQPGLSESSALGPRLGVIASKKVGGAVVRNRIKRHLREAFRNRRSELSCDQETRELNFVVIARSRAGSASALETAAALNKAIGRLRRKLVATNFKAEKKQC